MSKSTHLASFVKNPDQTSIPLDTGPAWVVYVLCDPRETDPVRRIRYVGVTHKEPSYRLAKHIDDVKWGKGQTHKKNWIKNLLTVDLSPTIEIVDPGTEASAWGRSEMSWIDYFRQKGCPLTNTTKGGEGSAGHTMSEESRRKMSEAQRQRMANPESRAHLSRMNTGHKPSDVTRARLSAANVGHVVSEETRHKLSKANTGHRPDADALAKMSSAALRRFEDATERQRIGDMRRGTHLSIGHKTKISAGLRAYHAEKQMKKSEGEEC